MSYYYLDKAILEEKKAILDKLYQGLDLMHINRNPFYDYHINLLHDDLKCKLNESTMEEIDSEIRTICDALDIDISSTPPQKINQFIKKIRKDQSNYQIKKTRFYNLKKSGYFGFISDRKNSDRDAMLRIIEEIDKTTKETKKNTDEIKRLISAGQEAIEKMTEQQKESLSKELIEWLNFAFTELDKEIDEKFEKMKSSKVQVKLQQSLPLFIELLTGLNLRVEVNITDKLLCLKKKAEAICLKLGLNNFIT